MALVWMVEVIDNPTKDHVGLVRWTCTKDRFGAVGRGTSVEFHIGGDGQGGIVGSVGSTTVGDTAARTDAKDEERRERENRWRINAVMTAKQYAPDEARAVSKSTLEDLYGRRQGRGQAARHPARHRRHRPVPPDSLGAKAKPTGNGTVVWWKPSSRPSRPTDGDESGQVETFAFRP